MPEPLKDHQLRAIKHLNDNPHAGLFLDMGLGKTRIVLETLTAEHLPALVIAPKRVAENVWQAERDKWEIDLTIGIAAGSPAQRKAVLESSHDITVIGRDNIKDVPHGRYETIVLDELSGFKSHRSQRYKAARRLTGPAPYVWGLTGTPTPNGLMDLWSQMFLLDRGARLENGIGKYRDRYFKIGAMLPQTHIVTRWDLKPGAEESIHRKISDICLSMFSDDHLDLPAVTYNAVEVPLPPKVMKIYREFKQELVADIDLIGVFTAASAGVLSSKLAQISSGFLYKDDDSSVVVPLHDEKIKAIQEIVDGTGSPILLFYKFVAEKEEILRSIDGAVTIDDPGAIDRWNAGQVPVLLAHPASAGHGLNLQYGGHTVVWASLPWSLEEYMQGNGRIARQGQEHPVVIHHLLSPGTVDSHVLKALEKKESVQDALLNHLSE